MNSCTHSTLEVLSEYKKLITIVKPLGFYACLNATKLMFGSHSCTIIFVLTCSLHDRVVKKGVSFLRGNVSIITFYDLSDMHVISMNVILPPRRREG